MKATYLNRSRSPRTTKRVHLDPVGQDAFDAIYSSLCRRYRRLEDRPSISLLLQGLVIRYAMSLQSDPSKLRELVEEIRSRSIVTDERRRRKRAAASPAVARQ